ncbi:cell division protein FtsY [Corynebacterium atypicum]|uniref:Signal recognition particle receptor FtsY n=2 Tax=Corynebacterium atypicum TaxID=191610 RepID=A0ABN4DF98_9CORY|nr:cell division protein FtsY [Corynebacterium atypicum]
MILISVGLIAAVVIIALVALVIVGRRRAASKTVSFHKEEEPKELTQQEKSGNYQAKGGFNFSSGAAAPGAAVADFTGNPREHEAVATPADQPASQEADSTAAEHDPEPAPAAQPEPEPEPEVAPKREPEAVERDVTPEPEPEPDAVESDAAEQDAREAAAAAAAAVAAAAEAKAQPQAEPEQPAVVAEPTAREDIAPVDGRMGRLRGRLSRSQNMIGKSVLGILSAGDLDEDAWEEIEDTLIMADLGTKVTMEVVDKLRERIATRGVSSEAEARDMLREVLIEVARPELDRSIKAMPYDGKPAVILMVGVNGTGKTTTTGKLGRVLVSMGHSVVFGAADTFRAAAADQLETWARRVGATTVRGKEGADPASVAFDAVARGAEENVDVVLIDTAGRFHTSVGLMDQLGKVKRVVEKRAKVDEVLLVLDATVGQNGLMQARTFRDVVDISGVVLTKLDGTAKGGIVFQVQEELGVPVKLVGLGEGADDLAPFEVDSFVDALLG